ncbi:response regulator [Pedobacter aquatilis]|uniref:response regulator n=1 Tax=Pedobacter aquatilis TaxID=351343 RepID=UPI0029318E98|nr:response regulator [Pedobacter aquatilis]
MKRTKTLVIDDDELMLFLFRIMIEDMQRAWDADYFPGAQEALRYLELKNCKELHFLIFLDIYMPGTSGWDMLERLKNHSAKNRINIVIVSASISKKDLEKAKEYKQVKAYIIKPFLTKNLTELANNPELSEFFEYADHKGH